MVGLGGGDDGDGMEGIDIGGHFVAEAERIFNAFDPVVLDSGGFEIHVGAGLFAGGDGGVEEGLASGVEEGCDAGRFLGVFGGADDLLAGSEAAAHFAVDAAGVGFGGDEVFLAAAELEEVEEFGFEHGGGGAGTEGSEVDGGGTAEAGDDLGAGEGVGEDEFEVRGEAEADFFAVVGAEVLAGEVQDEELGFEFGAGELVFDTGSGFAEVEESLEAEQAAVEDVGAGEPGFAGIAGKDQVDGGAVGEGFEGFVVGEG